MSQPDALPSIAIHRYLETGVATHAALAEARAWVALAEQRQSHWVDDMMFLVDRIHAGLVELNGGNA